MTIPANKKTHHTQSEQLTLARIRLKTAKFELKLLKAAVRTGRLPTPDTYIQRMIASTFSRCFQ